jgi:hypothetical protein
MAFGKAFKGFVDRAGRDLRDLDRIAGTTIANGQRAAAERVVREMQKAGPSWSGEFSNSWEIRTASRTVRGTGSAGEPQPIRAPSVTGQEAIAGQILKDPILTISNFSLHALEAIDAIEHSKEYYARRLTPTPQTALGLSKWTAATEGRANSSARGQIGGGDPNSISSRTAPMDWFATYASAKLDRAVRIEMDSALRRRFG